MGLSLVMMAAGILGAGAQGLNVEAARGLVMAAHAKGTFDGVVVVSEGGKPLMVAAVGEADRGSKDGGSKAGGKHVAVRPETVFRLASLTKQVTALLVMQQVEQGKLRLEERAGEAMPGLPEAVGKVTIRQLLQHQSGLANPSDGPEDVVPAFYARVNLDDASNVAAAKGACGAAGIAATLLSLNAGFLAPTVNYETPDPECDLDYIPNEARPAKGASLALCNCMGFGSKNSALVLRAGDGSPWTPPQEPL